MEAIRLYITDKQKEDRKRGKRFYVTNTENMILDPENPFETKERTPICLALAFVRPESKNFFEYVDHLLQTGVHVVERKWPIESGEAVVIYPLEMLPTIESAYQLPITTYQQLLDSYRREVDAYMGKTKGACRQFDDEIEQLQARIRAIEVRRINALGQMGPAPSLDEILTESLTK